MMKKHHEEPRERMTKGLSYTETFVKKITDLLKQGLTAENYEAALQSVLELCKENYDLNRAGAATVEVAQKQPYKSGTFNLYCKMAGDLFKMQCQLERDSGRTTIFTGFYNSATDAYLDGGYVKEATGVAFEHSLWLVRNSLYRDEAGKQKYLDLSVKAFDQVMKRADEDLANFIYEQREGRRKAAELLGEVQPPAHLANIKDAAQLNESVEAYHERVVSIKTTCKTYDIAAYLSSELATVLEKALPELAGKYTALAEELRGLHVALLEKHGIL